MQFAFEYFLFRLAVMGDSVESHHVTEPTGWYRAVTSSYGCVDVPGGVAEFRCFECATDSFWCLRGNCGSSVHVIDLDIYYQREEQPSRSSFCYLWNIIGVAGGEHISIDTFLY